MSALRFDAVECPSCHEEIWSQLEVSRHRRRTGGRHNSSSMGFGREVRFEDRAVLRLLTEGEKGVRGEKSVRGEKGVRNV